MALSLTRIVHNVEHAVETLPLYPARTDVAQTPEAEEVYPEQVVIDMNGAYWIAEYSIDESGVVSVAPQSNWRPADNVYIGKAAEMRALKAGARHSVGDQRLIQDIHDKALELGAALPMPVTSKPLMGKNNALKAVSRTTDELRVANYMVLFGGRDLEGIVSTRKNKDGSAGEYFTKATDFASPYTDTGMLYVDWEHGQAPADEPGPDDVLGYVDWKSAKIDERGVFVERVLNRRNRYVSFLEELIDAGMLGNSSEAIGGQVEKADDGAIKRWPLRRDTLTVTPMEPRMISDNALLALKALAEYAPALKSIIQAEDADDAETVLSETGSKPVATVAEDADEADRLSSKLAQRLSLELDLLTI